MKGLRGNGAEVSQAEADALLALLSQMTSEDYDRYGISAEHQDALLNMYADMDDARTEQEIRGGLPGAAHSPQHATLLQFRPASVSA